MRREMERGFEDAFKNMQAKTPKDLVKEYHHSWSSRSSSSYMVIQ